MYAIYEDFTYLDSLHTNSESFRLFTQNSGVGMGEIRQFNKGLQEMADFHPLTIKFLEILAEGKRLVYIKGICERYIKLYA
jgi:F0F1-type ATP synthase delta subunit